MGKHPHWPLVLVSFSPMARPWLVSFLWLVVSSSGWGLQCPGALHVLPVVGMTTLGWAIARAIVVLCHIYNGCWKANICIRNHAADSIDRCRDHYLERLWSLTCSPCHGCILLWESYGSLSYLVAAVCYICWLFPGPGVDGDYLTELINRSTMPVFIQHWL